MSKNRARGLSRRRFLKGTAAVSLGTAATAAGITPAGVPTAVAEELPPIPPHGAQLRGMDLVVQSPTTEGRFGFMFKSQPPLAGLGYAARPPGCDHGRAARPPTPASYLCRKRTKRRLQRKPQPALTSGFTFVGQFVDHDITFDTTLLSDQQSDPYATTNFRTPRYDLDAIYGRGPGANPQFYDPNDRDKFLVVDAYSQITGKLKRPDGVDETKTWDVCPTRSRTCPAPATR